MFVLSFDAMKSLLNDGDGSGSDLRRKQQCRQGHQHHHQYPRFVTVSSVTTGWNPWGPPGDHATNTIK